MSESAKNDFTVRIKMSRLRKYASREKAAMTVPYSPETIYRHEVGMNKLDPGIVSVYASAYDDPALMLRYCECCAIGNQIYKPLADRDLSSAVLRICNRTKKLPQVADDLADIADDSIIDEKERQRFNQDVEFLCELNAAVGDMLLYALENGARLEDIKNCRHEIAASRLNQQHKYNTAPACGQAQFA